MGNGDSRPAPLAGVRVLDLSRLLPGPLCGQHLADLGAEVIKIEDTGAGDYARPALRALVNRGKKGMTLNLKSEAGLRILLELVDRSDVLLESFRPGVMERLGAGWERLRARRPALVYCAITGYGQDGARARAPGHDINYLALAGVLDQTGSPGGVPVLPGFLLGDLLGGTLAAATGILAALVEARATGRGRFIDVSMTDAVLAHSILAFAELNESGHVRERGRGSHTGGMPRYGLYATRDGRYLAVGAQEKKFWDTLCAAIGAPELAGSHALEGDAAAPVRARLERIFATRDLDEWMSVLEPVECCVSPVRSFAEAVADPETRRRGTVVPAPDGAGTLPGMPFAIEGLACDATRPSPRRGQHNAEVLGLLGYGDEDRERLAAQGVI